MRIGSLFSGYGGLDLAVERYFGGTTAWHVEFDKHPSTVLARRWPGVPNHGDITTVDWDAVEPVDILTGGYPCQPFSHAGTRKGANDDRHLWPYFADAIRLLRPRLVVLENVAGHLTLGFDAVLADLAALGFDAEWGVVSASDAGAPHRRQRLFIVATDAADDGLAWGGGSRPGRTGLADRDLDPDGLTLLPTPVTNDMGRGKTVDDWDAWTDAMRARHGNGNGHGKSLEIEAQRLTIGDSDATSICETGPREVLRGLRGADAPQAVRAVADAGGHGPVLESQDMRPVMREHEEGSEEGHAALAGKETQEAELRGVRDGQRSARPPRRQEPGEQRPGQPDDAVRVLPPETALARGPRGADAGGGEGSCDGCRPWGPYAPAIHRWEIRLGRLAPSPTVEGKDGRPRLSARAVEFLMGLPDGWVTGVGISRSAQLKALGNGVVPQQAALALSLLLPRLAEDIA